MWIRAVALGVAVAVAASLGHRAPARAEASELRITRQPGLIFLPMTIMEHDRLIEKHAAAAGLDPLAVSWIAFATGGGSIDALVSGNVDVVATGTTNMLILWAKTRGDVKAISGVAALPLMLVSRNPAIRTVADFTGRDKIAVPTVKVSINAVLLQMAAVRAFGESGWDRLDPLTVAVSHPEAVAAMLNPNHEIDAHMSAPPFLQRELADPAIHVVTRGNELTGGPADNTLLMSTTKFHDSNSRIVRAVLDAFDEAVRLIASDKPRAIAAYLDVTHEKYPAEMLIGIISDPEYVYSSTPLGTGKYADFMYRTGLLKTKAESWKDFFFSEAAAMPGS